MITRIVKMTFRKEQTSAFEKIFEEVRPEINNFKGCNGVELYQDKKDTRIYFTVSTWTSESDLENYRQSGLFKGTWQKTKPLFEEPAQAWTVENLLK